MVDGHNPMTLDQKVGIGLKPQVKSQCLQLGLNSQPSDPELWDFGLNIKFKH